MPWNPIGAPLLDKPRDRRRAEHRARTMVANAEPWLGDSARRVATEEPKAEDTDDEGDTAWEDSKKSNDDGALDHIVASALKGAAPSRRSAVRDLLLPRHLVKFRGFRRRLAKADEHQEVGLELLVLAGHLTQHLTLVLQVCD